MASLNKLVVNLSANTKRFDKSMKRSQSMVKRLATGLAAMAAARISVAGFRNVIAAATEQEQAEKKLAAVIRATGGAAGFTSEQLHQYASDLQDVTNFGDEATISAMAVLAQFKNISGQTFKDVVESAMDISTVFGQDLQSSMRALGRAMADPLHNVESLERIGVVLDQQALDRIKTLHRQGNLLAAQQAIMDEVRSRSGGAAREAADSVTQLGGVWGDLLEKIGAGTKFVITPFVIALTEGLKLVNSLMEELGDSVESSLGPLEKMTLKWERIVWALKLFKDLQPWFWIQGQADFFPPGVGIGKNGKAGDKATGDTAGETAGETSSGKKFAAALGRGSTQAYSAIMNATGNKQNQKLDLVVSNGRETNTLLRQIADQTREGAATVVPALGIA